MHKKTEKMAMSWGVFGAAAVGVAAMVSSISVVHADSTVSDTASANASVTVASGCTLASTVNTAHSATIGNNASVPATAGGDGVGLTTMKVTCNDSDGFAIYAIGYSGNEYGNNNLIGNNGLNIATGTDRTGDNSSWAMRVNAVTSTSVNNVDADLTTTPTILDNYDTYHAVPSTYTKVAYLDSVTDLVGATNPSTGSSITTTYQIYVSPLQPYGEYAGQVKYTMVHPSTISNLYYMQDVATWSSTLTSVGDSTQVVDKRDGQVYTVAKLADGKIWMVDNLELAGGTALYSGTSDVPDGYTDTAYYTLPASATTGFDVSGNSYVYNSDRTGCASDGACYSYYSWAAATAGNQTNVSDGNAPYSICPKGWGLPTTSVDIPDTTRDFRVLVNALGGDSSIYNYSSSTTPTGASLSAQLLGVPNFLLAGSYQSGTLINGGTSGNYWSAATFTTSGPNLSYALEFDANNLNAASPYNTAYGMSVRCVAD